jgi:hypothetical protein
MNDYNTYRVEVSINTDFLAGWKDDAVPNMDFMYDQESLEECEEIDGIFYATYSTWIVETEKVIEMATPSGVEFITIPVGEYGLRP